MIHANHTLSFSHRFVKFVSIYFQSTSPSSRLAYFMNPATPSPLASFFGFSLSIKLGFWLPFEPPLVEFLRFMSLPYEAGLGLCPSAL